MAQPLLSFLIRLYWHGASVFSSLRTSNLLKVLSKTTGIPGTSTCTHAVLNKCSVPYFTLLCTVMTFRNFVGYSEYSTNYWHSFSAVIFFLHSISWWQQLNCCWISQETERHAPIYCHWAIKMRDLCESAAPMMLSKWKVYHWEKNAESSSEFIAWFAVQSFYSLLTFCTANFFAPISWQRPTNLQMLFAWEISYQSMPYSTSLLQRKWRGGKWVRSSRSLACAHD